MVDLQTAMAAAAAERQQRLDKTAEERKKRRSGANLGIERFDPVKHVSKERAETASMWLVLSFATIVALGTRYVLMDIVGPGDGFLLWFLPISMLGLLPAIHRRVMPEAMKAHYKGGTWFKAAFLHTFTFLALSFLLVNPPFGDIVAASLDGEWRLVVLTEDAALPVRLTAPPDCVMAPVTPSVVPSKVRLALPSCVSVPDQIEIWLSTPLPVTAAGWFS